MGARSTARCTAWDSEISAGAASTANGTAAIAMEQHNALSRCNAHGKTPVVREDMGPPNQSGNSARRICADAQGIVDSEI